MGGSNKSNLSELLEPPLYNPLAEFQVNGLTSKYALHHLLC